MTENDHKIILKLYKLLNVSFVDYKYNHTHTQARKTATDTRKFKDT